MSGIIGPIDAGILVLYLVVVTGIGLYQAYKIRTAGDYFAGGRRFNKFLMMMHALGTGTHADDPVGVTGAAFQHGLSGIWYTFIYLPATPFYWLIAAVFRRTRYITTADFFRARYSSRMALLYSVMGICTFAVSMGMMLLGTAQIASAVTGGYISRNAAMAGMTAAFVIYGLAGGLVATVVTESIQGLLIVVMSLLLIPFGLKAVGGFAELHRTLDPAYFSLTAPEELTPAWILAAAITALISIVAQPHTMEVCASGRSEFEGRVGFTYGNMIKRFCAMGWAFTGVIVLALVTKGAMDGSVVSGHREQAFGAAIRSLLPTGFTGLMFAAIFAAQMSRLSAFMVAGSALFSHNIYKGHLRPFASDAQVLLMGRISGILIVLSGILLAASLESVAQAVTIFIAMTSLPGLLIWGGVLWRRATAAGAWASFGTMLAIWATLGPLGGALRSAGGALPDWFGMYASKSHLPDLVLGYLPAGIVAFVVVSLLTRRRHPKEVDEFFSLIETPVGQEGRLIEAGVPIVYSGETDPHPWETRYPLLVAWGGFVVAGLVSAGMLAILLLLSRIGG